MYQSKPGSAPKASADADFKNWTDFLANTAGVMNVNTVTFWAQAAFQGFDPLAFHKKLMEAFEALGGDYAAIKPNAMAVRMEIIMKAILYFVQRGANVSSAAISKSAPEVQVFMNDFVDKLKFTSKVNENGGKGFTLPRLAATYPGIVAGFYSCGLGRQIVETEAELPAYYQFPGSNALMTPEEWTAHSGAYITYLVDLANVINAKNKEWKKLSEEEKISTQASYANIVRNAKDHVRMLPLRRAQAAEVCKKLVAINKDYKPAYDYK